jgi:hypothetical protein
MKPNTATGPVSDATGLQVFKDSGISVLRFVIALLIVLATYRLMKSDPDVPGAWQAVFLLAIGFYFKDRPAVERASLRIAGARATEPEEAAQKLSTQLTRWWQTEALPADLELFLQFILSLSLLGGTWLFLYTTGSATKVPASWIGAALLAVGFYPVVAKVWPASIFKQPVQEHACNATAHLERLGWH